MENKRIIDMTAQDLLEFIIPKIEEAVHYTINKSMTENVRKEMLGRVVSVNELVKMKIVGARDRVRALIKKGHIQLTSDGKINFDSVQKYIENAKDKK